MSGKLAIIVSAGGVESVTIISDGKETRAEGRSLCEFLENEISDFESAIKNKFNNFDKPENTVTQ
ncbi:MAG: hypothetical protein ACHQ6U_04940 [Thermodesulfobacteriota bacterium]